MCERVNKNTILVLSLNNVLVNEVKPSHFSLNEAIFNIPKSFQTTDCRHN